MQGYVRYVDDFLVFSDDKRQLARRAGRSSASFWHRCGCGCTPPRTRSSRSPRAFAFWATACFPRIVCWSRTTCAASAAACGRCSRQYAAGEIGPDEIRQRLMSWSGHARQADTYLLRQRLFATIAFQRATAE